MAQIEFVGVDGCPCGWFSVGFDGDGGYVLKGFRAFCELVEYYKGAKLILVDVIIGLLDDPERDYSEKCSDGHQRAVGWRCCDTEARDDRILPGNQKSRVFRTPNRHTTNAVWEYFCDYQRANKIERLYAKMGLSAQTFGIVPMTAEVDKLMVRRGDGATPQIREVHPEICFWALNGQQSIAPSKMTDDGIKQRLAVLQKVEPKAQEIFDAACFKFPDNRVAKDDDVLDALAAAVTARRGWQSDGLRTLPENPCQDSKGLAMEMVYWVP